MISTILSKEVTELIQGPTGQLEVLVSAPTEGDANAWGVICHPHPLYGGTMHNKVVTTLSKAYQAMGATTVRFNFRGIGRSEGTYDNGEGELDDLVAVLDWVQKTNINREIWLAGFSFGAFIAAKAAAKLPVKKLVTISPAVQNFPMNDIGPITCPWVLIQGERDDVVSPEAVFEWVEQRDPKPILIKFPEAGHFFHGQLTELRESIIEALR